MSGETTSSRLDVTTRDLSGGQKVFSRFTLVKMLGRGGMGVVWLAQDDELERNVALKFLPELIFNDRAVVDDMKRETRRSLDLTHKNIVRIYDFVHDTESGCISMEYVDGDTLSNLRTDKPHKVFETRDLKDWTSQLCAALDYAHNEARVVHRDLKPANLMVNQRGHLKVADFGIARSLSDSISMLTMEQGRSGTLLFMSPQQLDGDRGTHLDDIYSFGATIYELLTSKPPFWSGNVDRQIREKIPPTMALRRKELAIEGEPIDQTWERVVAECLAKNPARRPQSFAEIAQRLEIDSPNTVRAKNAEADKARASGGGGILTTLSSKPALMFGGIAALLFVALLAIFLIWYFAFPKPAPTTSSVSVVVQQPPGAAVAPPLPPPVATPAPEENAANTFGGVMLDTVPKGATVTLGGIERGKTPVTFKGVRTGKYPLRISLEGYIPVEREVEVKPDQFVDIGMVTLVRSAEMTEDGRGSSEREGEMRLEPSTPPRAQPANVQLVAPVNDFGGG